MKSKIPALLLLLAPACGPSPIASPSETGTEASTDEPATTSMPADSGDTSESGDSSDLFLPKLDQPPVTSCDPFAQDCPEGEKCVPYASSGNTWDANKCVPVTGDQAPGEPCIYAGAREGTDDCDATSMCWNTRELDGELVGECLPFCLGSPDTPECPEGSFCPLSSDGTINVCIPLCDPIAQNCDEPLGCYWAHTQFACIAALQNIPLGEPCGFINDCAPGLGCFTAEVFPDCDGSACCGAFCDLGLGDAQCEAMPGTSCMPFFEAGMAPPEYEHVGVCILP